MQCLMAMGMSLKSSAIFVLVDEDDEWAECEGGDLDESEDVDCINSNDEEENEVIKLDI